MNWKGWILRWSSAHFYWVDSWPDKKNFETFGLCAHKEGHGHNYKIEILFPEEGTDFIRAKATMGKLKEKLDHKNINLSIIEFKNQIPTTENIALWFFKNIENDLKISNIKIKLWENDNLWISLNHEN